MKEYRCVANCPEKDDKIIDDCFITKDAIEKGEMHCPYGNPPVWEAVSVMEEKNETE